MFCLNFSQSRFIRLRWHFAGHDDIDQGLVREVADRRVVSRLGGVGDATVAIREALGPGPGDAAHGGRHHARFQHFSGEFAVVHDHLGPDDVGTEHVDRNRGLFLAGLVERLGDQFPPLLHFVEGVVRTADEGGGGISDKPPCTTPLFGS